MNPACPTQTCQLAEPAATQTLWLPAHSPARKKRRGPLIWGIVSTVLSAVGFIALALFEQYNSMLSELRADLKHFNETAAEFVKRDSFQRFRDQVRERIKEMEQANLAKAQLEQELRVSEKAREELAHEMQRLRERLAFLEGRQTASPHAARPADQ
jgi:biopolymer transport protein ExbB/TolQ